MFTYYDLTMCRLGFYYLHSCLPCVLAGPWLTTGISGEAPTGMELSEKLRKVSQKRRPWDVGWMNGFLSGLLTFKYFDLKSDATEACTAKHPICSGLREKAVFRFPVLDQCFGLFAVPTAAERRHNAALVVFSMNCSVYSYATRFHWRSLLSQQAHIAIPALGAKPKGFLPSLQHP